MSDANEILADVRTAMDHAALLESKIDSIREDVEHLNQVIKDFFSVDCAPIFKSMDKKLDEIYQSKSKLDSMLEDIKSTSKKLAA